MATYRCCRHCRCPEARGGHPGACQVAGCKGSALPNAWFRLASLLSFVR